MPRNTKDKFLSGTGRNYYWNKSITGTAGVMYHLFQSSGMPSAGSYGSFAASALAMQQVVGGTSPSIAGGYLSPTNPTSPNKNYLSKSHLRSITANGHGTIYVLDWLICYRGFDGNVNTAQNTTGSAAGDDDRPRTYDDRTMIFVDVSTALGATPANLTVTYTSTKSGNPSSRSTGAQALTASSVAGRVPHAGLFLPLQGDDPGVASIQTAQLSAAMGVGGVFSINLVNVLAEITQGASLIGETRQYVDDECDKIEVPTNAAITLLWVPSSSVTSQLNGLLRITETDLEAA